MHKNIVISEQTSHDYKKSKHRFAVDFYSRTKERKVMFSKNIFLRSVLGEIPRSRVCVCVCMTYSGIFDEYVVRHPQLYNVYFKIYGDF